MASLQLCTTTTTTTTNTFSLLKSNLPLPKQPTSNANHLRLQHLSSTPFSLLRPQSLRRPLEAVPTATTEGLPEELRAELMPRHVAVIMDGNVRWARQRGLPGTAGHVKGARSMMELVDLCSRWGIKVLSVFAFSTDNWARSKVEVDFLMSLFEREIKSQRDKFKRDDVRISVIGDSSKLPTSLQKLISQAENDTKDNSKLQLIVALSYSGKYDIMKACRNIAKKVEDGVVQVEEINEGLIEQELETSCTQFPNPDLLIRTSGELRVSNFLLWQLAYTELFFAKALWPDFGQEEFVEALKSYQQRNRRYGKRDLPATSTN